MFNLIKFFLPSFYSQPLLANRGNLSSNFPEISDFWVMTQTFLKVFLKLIHFLSKFLCRGLEWRLFIRSVSLLEFRKYYFAKKAQNTLFWISFPLIRSHPKKITKKSNVNSVHQWPVMVTSMLVTDVGNEIYSYSVTIISKMSPSSCPKLNVTNKHLVVLILFETHLYRILFLSKSQKLHQETQQSFQNIEYLLFAIYWLRRQIILMLTWNVLFVLNKPRGQSWRLLSSWKVIISQLNLNYRLMWGNYIKWCTSWLKTGLLGLLPGYSYHV